MSESKKTREEATSEITQIFREEPGLKKWYALLVRYAEQKGGLTLSFWKTHRGTAFLHPDFNHPDADPNPRSIEETAAALKVPVSSIERILKETSEAIRPQWMATRE
jgi:hypothetical protein